MTIKKESHLIDSIPTNANSPTTVRCNRPKQSIRKKNLKKKSTLSQKNRPHRKLDSTYLHENIIYMTKKLNFLCNQTTLLRDKLQEYIDEEEIREEIQ